MADRPTRAAYKVFYPITTRWMDNDIYGHVNNVIYYSYFDSAVNMYLINEAGLDIAKSPVVGFIVSSRCNYHAPVAYPDKLQCGVRVNRLGNSSVEYGVALFKEGKDAASADGSMVHVFVDRRINKPVPIPHSARSALEKIEF